MQAFYTGAILISKQNVERLRAIYEAFNASKQIALELLTPDVEFTQPEIGENVYHGREGVARGVQELFDVFEDIRAEPEEFFVAGSEVVVFVRLSGRARGSGCAGRVPPRARVQVPRHAGGSMARLRGPPGSPQGSWA
jgi:SnoaL-like polyketide cyclase.